MKWLLKKTKKLVRGTSTAVLVSAGLHILLLVFAASWVVFTVAQNKAAKFTPVQINRPKMNLQKLRVKVQESSKPRKSSERIVSSKRVATMPEMNLPQMTGMGGGLEKGIGGFELMGDLSQMTVFGAGRSVGNDLEGTFYYFPWDRSGNPIPSMTVSTEATDPQDFVSAIKDFLANNWSPRVWDRFYRAPAKLYATQLMVPPAKSYTAPQKFGIKEAADPDFKSCLWAVHYKGKIANKTGGTFRFWGFGDDLFYIRINGKVVLNASHADRSEYNPPDAWQSTAKEHRQYILGNSRARVGDWFTLEPGVPVDMEALMCEVPGGTFTMMLLVEEKGVEYKKNQEGMPILPIFKTMKTPEQLLDEIKYTLVPGQADLEGGPIFSAY